MTDLFGGNPPQESTQEQGAAPQSPEAVTPEVTPQAAPQADPYTTMLAEIKAEDGRQKYADVNTALQSIPHAQGRITELSYEVQRLQEELAKRQGMEDIMQQLQSNPEVTPAPQAHGLDEGSVAAIVRQQLVEQAKADGIAANRSKVATALKDKFGEKAESEFNTRAASLGVTPEWLTQQAETYPDFVLSQFNVKGNSSPTQINHGSVMTQALHPRQESVAPVIRGATGSEVVDAYRAMQAQIKG